MRIEKKHTAALAVDYQEKLVPAMWEKEKLLESSGILLAGLKELEVPVILTQQYTKGLGNTVREITEAAGTDQFIEKISFSCFKDTKAYIREKKYVIVCGIEAHICVLQTVMDLCAEGYIPVLVSDCISSRKKYDKEMALKRAVQEGALVTTCEAVLFELLEEAGTPVSKKIQRLVK